MLAVDALSAISQLCHISSPASSSSSTFQAAEFLLSILRSVVDVAEYYS